MKLFIKNNNTFSNKSGFDVDAIVEKATETILFLHVIN